MKHFIFLMLMVYCSSAFAQRVNPGTPTSSIMSSGTMSLSGGNDSFVFGTGIDMNSPKYNGVNGSPFLNQDYIPAYVVFKNGTKYSNVPVKFDMLHNEVDIEKNKELISLLGLDSVSYPDSNYLNMILKTGYPSVNKHDTNSIYQIVAQNNRIQLLKYYHCAIGVIKNVGMPDKSSFDVDDQYYLFNKATKTIKEIKLNKKSFSNVIEQMGYSKAEVDKNAGINFKNEKDVAGFINSMVL
ncbi:MAG: hypothetical protein JST87_12230 [Bacteroidetes bacterium]|nr:hypothetical protein [Bacteroidota bacterium]